MQEIRVKVNRIELQNGWLLDPEDVCKAILKFLSDTAH